MGVDHRLLTVDVLAGYHGIDGNLLVPVIGRADDHRVHIFSRQDFLVVARGENVIAPEFLAVLETAVVTVGYGYELHTGDSDRGPRVSLALNAGSNQVELDVIVGGERRGGFQRQYFEGVRLDSEGARGSSRARNF